MFTGLITCWVLLASLLGGGCKKKASETAVAAKNQFRAASYNIRYPAAADDSSGNGWEVRKKPLAGLMKSYQFDLVGTQEGYDFQLEDLKGMMPGFDYIKHPYGGARVAHNCATFYRTALFEVLESGVFWLSETPEKPSIGWDATDQRICSWTKFKIKKTGAVFYFFNVHFYWRLKTAREESGPLMVKMIKKIAGEAPVVCTGDFNSTAGTPQIKAVKGLLEDAYDRSKKPREGMEGTSFSGGVFQGMPKGRIDYIFVSEHFEVEDYKVPADVYNGNHYPSDHLPVTSLLSF